MNRISSIDTLRGIAALAVCVFHLTNGHAEYLEEGNVLRRVGEYGWLGVEVFFVISGFIIPYSMYNNSYSLQDAKTFLLRRITRIDPPYFVTILLVISLNYISTLSPYYGGTGTKIDPHNLFLHIGYLNGVMGEPWLTPVFWTLAIEFQFYLLVAVGLPLFIYASSQFRYVILVGMVILGFFITSEAYLFKYVTLFVIGIIAFLYRTHLVTKRGFIIAAGLGLLGTHLQLGLPATLAGALTLLVMHQPVRIRGVKFLGLISYSLYLIHVPVGGRIINLSTNFTSDPVMRSLMVLVAIGISISAAYLFFLWVEQPAMRIAKLIHYRRQDVVSNGSQHRTTKPRYLSNS